MSVALPDGWTDTGRVHTFTASEDVQLLNYGRAGNGPPSTRIMEVDVEGWIYYATQTFTGLGCIFDPTSNSIIHRTVELRILAPDGHTETVQVTNWSCAEDNFPTGPFAIKDSPTKRFSRTAGPYRLGVRLVRITAPASPEFWDNWRIEYHWFADEDTVISETWGSYTFTYYDILGPFVAGPPTPGSTPIDRGNEGGRIGTGYQAFSADLHSPAVEDMCQISNVLLDGVGIDLSEHNEAGWEPGTLIGKQGGIGSASVSYAPPFKFRMDLDISKFGDGTFAARLLDNWATVIDLDGGGHPRQPQLDYIQCPFDHTYVVQDVSWDTSKKRPPGFLQFDLQQAWADAQDPPIPVVDWEVPIYGSPARLDPGAIAPYRPISVTTGAVSIQRPNGMRPSDWVSSDTDKLTVAESSTSTVFHVIEEGASASRTLLTKWRDWCTPGDPHYLLDAYEITRHDYFGSGSDVFGWQHFGWLLMLIDAPADGTLTLQVEGVDLDVTDSHDGSDPILTEIPFGVVSYSVPLVTGINSVYVDLLYPSAGPIGPFYYGRVDKLTLSGFQVGDYTLNNLILIPREPGYVKCDFGAPVQRGDYDAIVWAQDGAFTLGNWPDQANKSEFGTYGGGVRHIFIFTDSEGHVADFQLSLLGFWTKMNRLEGFVESYDASVYEAANQDPYGNSLGPELAEWTWSIVPYNRVTPGTPYHPACSPRVRQIGLANGQLFHILVRWVLQAGIEQLVTLNGARAPAGTIAEAIRVVNGHVYTAECDVSGYAIIYPVPGETDYNVPEG